jgi:hypothetical protein
MVSCHQLLAEAENITRADDFPTLTASFARLSNFLAPTSNLEPISTLGTQTR